jgi:hypothetical protein
LRRHFRVDIDNPLLYDALWNTGQVELEEIADSVISLLESRIESWS